MTRPQMNAADIQAEVLRRVHQIPAVREGRENIPIPLPAPLIQFDSNGCNWYMAYGGSVGVHGHAVREVVEGVKAEWNLLP